MAKKELSFTDLKDKMVQVTTALITNKQFIDWLDENMEVKKYLPITAKYASISLFASTFDDVIAKYEEIHHESGVVNYMTYDINVMFDFLFQYTNCTVIPKYRTTDNYDLVMQSGLYRYIVYRCQNDFDDLKRKCDRVIGIDFYFMAKAMKDILGKFPTPDEANKITEAVNEIDTEKLQALRDIQAMNNPMTAKVIQAVKNQAYQEVKKPQEN